MKSGRNDPCGCGSGKKYKNCCLGKTGEQSARPSPIECDQLMALYNAGRLAELESMASALAARYPNAGFVWKLLGESLYLQGKDALHALQRTTELLPDDADAFSNLGVILTDLGLYNQAVSICRRVLQLKPGYVRALNNLGNALIHLGQLDDAVASYRSATEIQPDYVRAQSNLLFTLNYTSGYNPSYCLAEALRYGRTVSQKATQKFSSWQCARHPQRLRVGMVTGNLNSHPVGFFLEGLLAHLDQSRVELIAYPTNLDFDELTERIKPCFSAWRLLHGLNDEAAARLIHADGVHVLLDLSGHTAKSRLPIFGWKPAPVQVSWLGYFATTGVAEMDYLLADKVGVPDTQRGNFSETVWYLPDTRLCFTAPKADVPLASLPALKNGYITFGCFQNLPKVGEKVLEAWAHILKALPGAKLRWQCKQLADPTVADRLMEHFRRLGIERDRLMLHGVTSREAYLAVHAEVDVVLDTFPYPGGTTTCEALWMGVPTLTLAGDSLLSRQGASLLTAAGLEDWVAASVDDYIDKAIKLAGDLPGLAALRAGLRSQVIMSPLFDSKRFARNLEAALWDMWQMHINGNPPSSDL